MSLPRELGKNHPVLLVPGPVRLDVKIDAEHEDCCSEFCEHLSCRYNEYGKQVQEIRRSCDALGRLHTVWRRSRWTVEKERCVQRHPQCRAGVPMVRRQREKEEA